MEISEVSRILLSGGRIPLSYRGEKFNLYGTKKPEWYGKDNITVNGTKMDALYTALVETNAEGFNKAYKGEVKRVKREMAELAAEKRRKGKRVEERRKKLIKCLTEKELGIIPHEMLSTEINQLTNYAVLLVKADTGGIPELKIWRLLWKMT
jgi:hypothetical protein